MMMYTCLLVTVVQQALVTLGLCVYPLKPSCYVRTLHNLSRIRRAVSSPRQHYLRVIIRICFYTDELLLQTLEREKIDTQNSKGFPFTLQCNQPALGSNQTNELQNVYRSPSSLALYITRRGQG